MEDISMPKNGEITTQSARASRRHSLSETPWEFIRKPGAYVELGSGDLYRFPKEALSAGTSPNIVKESRGASVLAKLSDNPFISTFEARLTAAQHNIEPNF
jgi:hypothetical protein